MKEDVEKYRGDGEISYKKSGPLGVDGVIVKFPNFNFALGIKEKYSLSLLPKGPVPYVVYLVVNEPFSRDLIKDINCEFKYSNGNVLVEKVSGRVDDMTESVTTGKSRFYFYNKLRIEAGDNNKDLNLEVFCENKGVKKNIDAYILVQSGGFK